MIETAKAAMQSAEKLKAAAEAESLDAREAWDLLERKRARALDFVISHA
jgi:hypothetical protein